MNYAVENIAALAACSFFSGMLAFAAIARDIDIRAFGAVGDGKTLNTTFVQKAIDECSGAGGRRVVIEGGTYVTGTIVLKSGVELYIEANATLMGSPDWREWKDRPEAVIVAYCWIIW